MEISVGSPKDDKIVIKVTIPSAEIDKKISATYIDYARRYNFPGFRKGKAPRPVIDNAFTREVILGSVTEDVINDAYPKIIEEERIYPVGSPDFGDPGTVEDGKDFTFEFTQSIKPEYELTSYDPVSIEMPTSEVEDSEVEEQLDAMTERYQTYEDAKADDTISDDRCADLTIEATKDDGDPVIGLSSETAFYAPGTGIYSEAFGKEIEGMKAGDTKEFKLDVPEDEQSVLMSDVAGQTIDLKVTCNKVKIPKVPDLTDEWVKETLGYDDVKTLKDEIEKSISEQKASIMPTIKENLCSMELIKRFDSEIPASVLEDIESNLLQDFFSQLQKQGMSFDNYLMMQGIDSDTFKSDVKKQAEDNAKKELSLESWASHYGIEASDEDVTLEFERSGVEDPAKLQQEWKDQGRLYLIREGITRSKAMEDVMDKANAKTITMKEYIDKINENKV